MSKFKANKIVTKANVYAALDKLPLDMQSWFDLIDVSIVGGKIGGSEGPRRVRLWVMMSQPLLVSLNCIVKQDLMKNAAGYLRSLIADWSKIPLDRIEPVEVIEWDPMIAAMES